MSYYKHCIPVAGHKEINQLEVSLDYNLGGRNLMSGAMNERGLYIYVSPVELKNKVMNDGTKYQTRVTKPFDWKGYKKLLKPMSRKSDKSGRTMAKLVADEVTNKYGTTWKIIGAVLKENNITLA